MNKIKEKKTKTEKADSDEGWSVMALTYLRAINIFGRLKVENILSVMPFLLFNVLLALILIGNSFYTERLVRDIDRTSKDIKELQTEFITGRSELMFKTNQSQVAAMVEPMGLKESRIAPHKILVKNDNGSKKKK